MVCLLSDDTSMNALAGSIGERAANIIGGGCDIVLHCNGHMDEMQQVVANVPVLGGKPLERAKAVENGFPTPDAARRGCDPGRVRWNCLRRSDRRRSTAREHDRGPGYGHVAAIAPMDKLWQDNGAERASNDPALLIDVAGFEGPLDLLLYLARNQKVDLVTYFGPRAGRTVPAVHRAARVASGLSLRLTTSSWRRGLPI